MRKFYIFTILICFASTAQASSYYEQLIQQKQATAEAKRQQALQNVEARQSDPEGYMRAKYVSTTPDSDNGGSEVFHVASDNHYYIPVSINNKSLEFMADTGATGIFISQTDAKKLGINPQTLQYNQRYTTANGAKGRAAMAIAKTLKVGSIQMSDVPVVVSMEREHVALLGMEFFKRLKRYEVSDGKMKLYK
jgi:clan AA aspartic protease (TIGR02281 family)